VIRSVVVRAAKGRVSEDAAVFLAYRETKRLSPVASRLDGTFDGAAAALLASGTFRGERGETRGEDEPPRDGAAAAAHQAITTVEETFQDHMEVC